jgi:hypothetical protein
MHVYVRVCIVCVVFLPSLIALLVVQDVVYVPVTGN